MQGDKADTKDRKHLQTSWIIGKYAAQICRPLEVAQFSDLQIGGAKNYLPLPLPTQ